jgi:hypothetical protein
MTPFGKWLAEIGLARYEVVFASNEIDFDIIRSLTDTDLRELGLALGDRKRLLQAVARLDEQQAADTFTPLALLLPGIRINTSPTDYRPMKQLQPMRFNGHNWELFGNPLAG